ncbi:putative nucleotide-diphospho-sugar transferase [Neisseriaceae bacterium ESL0693]|nr:putative nucleotide-diphospho-sugar transferase [Neisseriaceae bacterium ESL0693]
MFKLRRRHAWRARNLQVIVPFPEVIEADQRAEPDLPMTVVAYHTDDELYRNEAKRMCASALRLGIKVKTTVVQSQGDWVRNTSFKSDYLLHERRLVKGPMLYVDVDAVFHRSPLAYLAQLDCDIAAHYDLGDGHLISATLFFQDTPAVHELLAQWHQQCLARPDVWDQKVLQDILEEDQQSSQPHYRIARLPVGFCWVFDRENNLKAAKQPVYIEQLQAGRMVIDKDCWRDKWFSVRKSKVQRRLDRVQEIEKVLFADAPPI